MANLGLEHHFLHQPMRCIAAGIGLHQKPMISPIGSQCSWEEPQAARISMNRNIIRNSVLDQSETKLEDITAYRAVIEFLLSAALRTW